MDTLRLDAPASAEEIAALDAVLGPVAPVSDRVARAPRPEALRTQLLPALHALHDRVGWISPGGLAEVGRRLRVPPADAYGVASFYAMFRLEAPAHPVVVHRCIDLACAAAGPRGALPALPDGEVVDSPCLGLCERAPAALAIEAGAPPRHAVLADGPDEPARSVPQLGDPALVLLRRVGAADPLDLGAYRAAGGGEAIAVARRHGPEWVRAEVGAAGLQGRGGAAFPTGRKWDAVAAQPQRDRCFIVNADESEPGTFKDRVLLEHDPLAIVEAAAVGMLATGSRAGYVYLRGEYPVARERLAAAIALGEAEGWFAGTDGLELRIGAGAYICGEETALCNSIEGFRGEPRNKPPFPVESGLFGRPTAVNNVETLANVLPIVCGGGAAFAATGAPGSTGTKLFCVSGAVRAPGVYEYAFGVTLREVLERAGVADGLRAVLLGGAAGTFVLPDELDVPLTFAGTRAIGASLGSGVVMAFGPGTDFGAVVARIAAFFHDESCGQCVPCRVGTQRQVELLAAARSGRGGTAIDAGLDDVAQVMREASICGLGQTAASAVQSARAKGLVG